MQIYSCSNAADANTAALALMKLLLQGVVVCKASVSAGANSVAVSAAAVLGLLQAVGLLLLLQILLM